MEVGVVPVRPTNDHELVIARSVDRIFLDGRLDASSIDAVISALNFTLSITETKFLVSYIRWRIENPTTRRIPEGKADKPSVHLSRGQSIER
jgi:uncharacterized protein YhdP